MRRIILSMFLLAAITPMAEARQSGTLTPRARMLSANRPDDGDRAMLGVSTGSSGKRDTLGLLIESVTPGSPAEKAGLEEGNRIASINGVSLKLSRDDAGEPDMSGTMTNRLVREMRKLKAGDEATLEVWVGGRYKSVKVKTAAANDLNAERISSQDAEDRAALGISLGSNGSKRDTLGVFVSGVSESGPADKAGIVEGDRIASVNGVDLRVPKEDIGDWSVASSRVARLQREVRKLKPGQTVELSVVEGGRARTVKVTLGRAEDLERSDGFSISTGDGGSFFTMPRMPMPPMSPMAPMAPMAPMSPMSPMPPIAPRARIRVLDGEQDTELNFDVLRESLRDIGPRVRAELDRELPRIRDELDLELPQAMDQVRREMDRLRIEMPLMRLRLGRGVII
jgi:serine protease Do